MDAPLIFDVIDTWNDRSLGGCAYHVSDPGGRSFEDKPVNANVAESRRLTRFEKDQHTPQPVEVRSASTTTEVEFQSLPAGHTEWQKKQLPKNQDYPYTADLRQAANNT